MDTIITYKEFQQTYWNLLDQICELKDPVNHADVQKIVSKIDKMRKKYPEFDKRFDKWCKKHFL